MKAIESILHLRREAPQRLKNMVPQHFWPLLARYGITPTEDERPLKKAP
jgi:coenzyme F420 hydrogenase subunit beta